MKNKIKRLIKRICLGLAASNRSSEMMGKGPGYGIRGNQRMKTLAATAVIATVTATAQAGSLFVAPNVSESSGGGFWAAFWHWMDVNRDALVQGLTTMNQAPPQALANNSAWALDHQPVPAPQGPATPDLMQKKNK